MKFTKSFAALLAALTFGGASQAAFVNVGEANGANNTSTGIVDGNTITTDQRWTRDNVYLLRRVIFITNGATLTIEPGTIIRGVTATMSGFSTEPGALVVSRGGKLVANGTPTDPVIFTSIDDPNVPGGIATVPLSFTNTAGTATTIRVGTIPDLADSDYDPDGFVGDNAFSKAARWGGIVICGNGYVAANTGSTDANADGIWDDHAANFTTSNPGQNLNVGADYPEGMSTNLAATVYNSTNALYGGLNDNDNSGVLRFVSIRYGGFVLGDPSVGNEINSLTICGAGMGTVIEHVESFANLDDGFEWFGGKSNSRFLMSILNQDDLFDGDEGYRGIGQFWLGVQGTINTTGASLRAGYVNNDLIGQNNTGTDYRYDKLMEWDGPEGNDNDRLPKTALDVYNFTFLAGDTQKRGIQARLEAQIGTYNGVVERASTVSQAAQSTTIGTITSLLTWGNVHSFTTAATGSAEKGTVTSNGVTVLSEVGAGFTEEAASSIATAWFPAGFTASPVYTKNGFDPRLAAGAAARTEDGITPPAGFVNSTFAGAFLDNNHLSGWSTLEFLQVLPASNLARPLLTIGTSGSNPTISWNSAGASIKYVVEKSTDGKVWTPVNSGTPVTGTGTITHTDTSTTVGAAVTYRVYGL